jgi:hypothetical protein
MHPIEITARFGNSLKHVEVTAPMGVGGQVYYILIDKYFNGQLIHENERWRCALHPTTILQGDDVQILIDMIEENA